MSTNIKTVWHLNILRFWDGKESALQFTPMIKDYSHLDQKEVKELIEVLQNAFDLDK